MSSPGSECRRLQRSTKGERQDPGFGQRAVVDGIEVDRGFLFALTTREKSHSCVEQKISSYFHFVSARLLLRKTPLRTRQRSGLPVTAGGTVRRKAVTVAMATSSGLYLVGQLCPAVTMLGLRSVPSRYTWWSDMALYTAARTCNTQIVSPKRLHFLSVSLLTLVVTMSLTHAHATHLLSDVLGAFQVMVSIRQNLWLYDGHDAMLAEKEKIIRTIQRCIDKLLHCVILGSDLLADTGVACKNISIFIDRQFRWIGVTDFEHAAPLCKGGSILFVLRTAL